MSFENPATSDGQESSPFEELLDEIMQMRELPAGSSDLVKRNEEQAEWRKKACEGLIAEKYEVRGELGHGGMGVVLEAYDRWLKRRVAIKRPLPGNERYDAWFQTEAKIIAGLDSEFIRRVLEFGRDEHGYYLVLEFVDGSSLLEHLRNVGTIGLGDAFDLAWAMASALKVAHDSKVIHRDVKPGNVLVSRSGKFKLSDFGLARPDEGTGRTRSKPMGTPGYVAPEQWESARKADERSDIFGLGRTVWFALTGETPSGYADDTRLGPFVDFVACSTEQEPGDRYQTAIEVLEALEELRELLPERRGGLITRWRLSGQPGLCPECHTVNLESHRFCSQCRGPLREPCPNCGVEVLTSAKYCGDCRVEIRNWREVLATLDRAVEYAAAQEYGRATAEIGHARRLAGDRPEIEPLETKARGEIDALIEARRLVEPPWQEGRFEEAIPHLKRILEIDPGDELARERLDLVAGRIRERDLTGHLSDLESAMTGRRIARARRIVQRICKLEPRQDDPRPDEAVRRYRQLRAGMIRQARIEFLAALELRDWPGVGKHFKRLLQAETGKVLLRELQLRARAVRALAEEKLQAARRHLGLLEGELSDDSPPWLKQLHDELELAERRRLRGVRTQIEQCRGGSDFTAARRALTALATALGEVRSDEISRLETEYRRRFRSWTWRRRARVGAAALGLLVLVAGVAGWIWGCNRAQGEVVSGLILGEEDTSAPKDRFFYSEVPVLGSMLVAERELREGLEDSAGTDSTEGETGMDPEGSPEPGLAELLGEGTLNDLRGGLASWFLSERAIERLDEVRRAGSETLSTEPLEQSSTGADPEAEGDQGMGPETGADS